MLQEIKEYWDTDHTSLMYFYFKDENNLTQGLYKHFDVHGNIIDIGFTKNNFYCGVGKISLIYHYPVLFTAYNQQLHGVKITKIFLKNDWNHLHDVILDSTGENLSKEQLEKIYESLPNHLKNLAHEYGMNDTEFREQVYKIYKKS